jgi:hypothetical protein
MAGTAMSAGADRAGMAVTPDPKAALDRANVELAKELFAIKASLDVYALVGLNADRIQSGKTFFGHIQHVSLLHVALGLAKVFERPKEHHLCSISGIYCLALLVPLDDPSALRAFVSVYGVEPTAEWAVDLAAVFRSQRPMLRKHLRKVYRARNTRIAHLQQDAPRRDLPSIAAMEELLALAVAFHDVINDAFLATGSHPILRDRKIADSLTRLLGATGLQDVVRDFPD